MRNEAERLLSEAGTVRSARIHGWFNGPVGLIPWLSVFPESADEDWLAPEGRRQASDPDLPVTDCPGGR